MSRALRRRAERDAKKRGGTIETKPPQQIQLANPNTDLFEVFIVGNSQFCVDVCEHEAGKDKTVVICGAGPSLADDAEEWCHEGDHLWGCNSALPWLVEHGYPVTHGITVDQTAEMVNEWMTAPNVEYLLASTVHPHLTDHLLEAGVRMRWFHNYVGIKKPAVEYCVCGHDERPFHAAGPCDAVDDEGACACQAYDAQAMAYEDWLYASLFPPTIRTGSGLNTVTRAMDLALCMGYEKIIVLGADCALRVTSPLPPGTITGSPEHIRWLEEDTLMHADGGGALASGQTAVTMGGEIDGRHWETKPDMAISAVFMLRMQQELGEERLLYIGDTLPNALKGKSDEFIARLPTLIDSEGEPIPITNVIQQSVDNVKVLRRGASVA